MFVMQSNGAKLDSSASMYVFVWVVGFPETKLRWEGTKFRTNLASKYSL